MQGNPTSHLMEAIGGGMEIWGLTSCVLASFPVGPSDSFQHHKLINTNLQLKNVLPKLGIWASQNSSSAIMLQTGQSLPHTKFVLKFPFLMARSGSKGKKVKILLRWPLAPWWRKQAIIVISYPNSYIKEPSCPQLQLSMLWNFCAPRDLRGYPDQGKLVDPIWLKELGYRGEEMEKSSGAQLPVDGLPVDQTEHRSWAWCCLCMGWPAPRSWAGRGTKCASGERFLLLSPGKMIRVKTSSRWEERSVDLSNSSMWSLTACGPPSLVNPSYIATFHWHPSVSQDWEDSWIVSIVGVQAIQTNKGVWWELVYKERLRGISFKNHH